MDPLEIIKHRASLFAKLPECKKERYASRYSIHFMEPIPFFIMTGFRTSGKAVRVSLYDAIDTILAYQKRKATAWRNMKGTFAYIVDHINRMRMSGVVIPIAFRNFDKGEMGLISMAYKLIEEEEGREDLMRTEINVLGFELESPFGLAMSFMFRERQDYVEYHYFVHDLTWFLRSGPLWFLKGGNIHCISDEDQKWLEANKDKLDIWDQLRGEFMPFVIAPNSYENLTSLSIM